MVNPAPFLLELVATSMASDGTLNLFCTEIRYPLLEDDSMVCTALTTQRFLSIVFDANRISSFGFALLDSFFLKPLLSETSLMAEVSILWLLLSVKAVHACSD